MNFNRFALLCFALEKQSKKCEDGYRLVSTGCYYKPNEKKSLDDGVRICKEKKGHVVTLESSKEQRKVLELISNPIGDWSKPGMDTVCFFLFNS